MTNPTKFPRVTRRRFLTGALAGGALVGGASGVLASSASASALGMAQTAADVGPTIADIGFCTDMTAHHLQALMMCERVLGFDTGDAVQAAATEVLRNQAIEVGMMRAWLADWDASTVPPERVMAWMSMDDSMDMGGDMDMADHSDMSSDMDMSGDSDMSGDMDSMGMPLADMPGYASDAEMLSLSRAEPGVPKGRVWLELMRAHHVGGVAMATAATELASAEKVVRLATTQAMAQAWEIEQYDLLLATKYA